ncbi:hypothetical protein [Saccharothrix australiensis]|uniref:Uncharacterized protein n=1 Tax=Saccharothrix australiensis TaxID=2072 RepID=A0A495W2E2_9PSEU|nr:hypothetical protein [Saccharothrix australiensis]RKT55310.1 hypothetical protein C8E97_3973 [Saccharothrix australiensis]
MTISRQRAAARAARVADLVRVEWVRRRRDLCAELCWQLLIVHFGLAGLVARTALRARREWLAARARGRAGTWWTRLGLGDAAEMALSAVGLPGDVVRYAVVVAVWLVARVHRAVVRRRSPLIRDPPARERRTPRGVGPGAGPSA